MKDNLIDFESKRNKKEEDVKRQKIIEERKQQEEKNIELLKEITGKATLFLSLEEMEAYQEVGVLCTFEVKDTYSMCIVVFREHLYVLNHIGGKFEYIGKLEDVIGDGIFGKERR